MTQTERDWLACVEEAMADKEIQTFLERLVCKGIKSKVKFPSSDEVMKMATVFLGEEISGGELSQAELTVVRDIQRGHFLLMQLCLTKERM